VQDLSAPRVGPVAAHWAGSSLPPISVGRLARRDGGAAAPAYQLEGAVDYLVDRFCSPVGNPFISLSARCACDAFSSLMALLVRCYLGTISSVSTYALQDLVARLRDCPPACRSAEALFFQAQLRSLSAIHGVRLHDYASTFDPRGAVVWLLEAALRTRDGASLRLLCWCRDDQDTRAQRPCHASVLASTLRSLLVSRPPLSHSLSLRAGDWEVADIFLSHPPPVAAFLATFFWPIADVATLDRLQPDSTMAPDVLVACEFPGAVSSQLRSRWGWGVLSVDSRAASSPGLHCVLDVRLVLCRRRWRAVFAFTPCTHQTLVDRFTRSYKEQDGRSFWGIAFFIFLSLCGRGCGARGAAGHHHSGLLCPSYSALATLRRWGPGQQTCQFVLPQRRRRPVPLLPQANANAVSGHKRLQDFEDAEARDRWRSSWLRFPRLAYAVASRELLLPRPACPEPLSYQVEVERFAVSWFERGLPVPHDYLNADAQPTGADARLYQLVRGAGHRVPLPRVVPVSLRVDASSSHSFGATDRNGSTAPSLLSSQTFVAGSFAFFMVSLQLTRFSLPTATAST
jgi:hypothetical protein